jgi:hypothetical protein
LKLWTKEKGCVGDVVNCSFVWSVASFSGHQARKIIVRGIDRRRRPAMSDAMNVLVACEFSGIVRDAFIAKGHNAVSCDLLLSERPGHHLQRDVMDVLSNSDEKFDLIIAHPPCTRLAVSGALHFHKHIEEQNQAASFFMYFVKYQAMSGCKMAIENPVGIMSTRYRKPDQYIQPWQFGHKETKKTGLWLYNLPKLTPTNNVYAEMMKLPRRERERIHYLPRTKDRGKIRSVTYQGIAEAMANAWG